MPRGTCKYRDYRTTGRTHLCNEVTADRTCAALEDTVLRVHNRRRNIECRIVSEFSFDVLNMIVMASVTPNFTENVVKL